MSSRTATVERTTSETQITCSIDLDHVPGVTKQVIEVNTGIGFLDHVSIGGESSASYGILSLLTGATITH
jgi:imidazoleglycerol phosphate dehydratase HisB